MAHKVGDRILDTFTTTGTGNITVSGTAQAGHLTLSDVLGANGDTGDFVLAGGTQWEIVRLTRVSANEYSRGTPYNSSTGSAINFSAGTKEVWGDISAFFAHHLNTVEITVTSAATCDIGAVHGSRILIDGNTGPITSLGTSAHRVRYVRFNNTPQINHHATSLILPTAANITAASGDTAIFCSDASGNWRCHIYQRASGAPLVSASAASESAAGIVELATTAEAEAGSDTARAVTPAGLKAAIAGEHTVNLLAAGMVSRTTNGATAYSTEKATNDVMVKGYEFSASTEQAIQIAFPLPKGYNSSAGMVVKFYWTTSATAGTGNVIWGIRSRYSRNDDAIDQAFGTAVEVTDGFLADGDTHITGETSAMTPGGTYAAECMCRFEVYRKAADGSDTYNQTAILEAVMISLPIAEMTDD